MALLTSFFLLPVSPAKIPTSNALFPRLFSPLSLSSSLTVKPIHKNNFTFITARVSLTHKYVYPDPCPHFTESETQKFKAELLEKLLNDKDEFGDELDAVIDVCAQATEWETAIALECYVLATMLEPGYEFLLIFGEFLRKDYGGPGTLLVEPFTDMLVALKKKKLPGAPLAARASLLWAQNYVDNDWEVWNSKLK